MGKSDPARSSQKSHRSYIRNVALSMMGQLKVADYVVQPELARLLRQRYLDEVTRRLEKMNAMTLGRIASYGLSSTSTCGTSLYDVHGGPWLIGRCGGRTLLVLIAATVIIAEIADIFIERSSNQQ